MLIKNLVCTRVVGGYPYIQRVHRAVIRHLINAIHSTPRAPVLGITLTIDGKSAYRSADTHTYWGTKYDFFILDWNNAVNRGKKHIANNAISNQQSAV